jgi:hypothetical protein
LQKGFKTGYIEIGLFATGRFENRTLRKPDVFKTDVLKSHVKKPDVLWVYLVRKSYAIVNFISPVWDYELGLLFSIDRTPNSHYFQGELSQKNLLCTAGAHGPLLHLYLPALGSLKNFVGSSE